MIDINLSIEVILGITASAVGAVLLGAAIALNRQGLFRWTTFGFWSWVAFLVYFVLTPFAILFSRETNEFELRMEIGGGAGRGLWIAGVVASGIVVFFWAYLRSRSTVPGFGLPAGTYYISPPAFAAMLAVLAFSVYSLLMYRAGILSGQEVQIVGGRFVGSVSGYQAVAHVFVFVPALLLLFSPRLLPWLFGLFLAGGYILLSLPNAWSRFATVSMLIAVSISVTLRAQRRWPAAPWMIAVFLLAAIFQLRGHTTWTLADSGGEIVTLASQLPARASSVLTQADTSMLATFYLESFLKDSIVGYDYGLPMINYLLTGWIPNRLFPEKYFLLDWLRDFQGKAYPVEIDNLLYGSKSSLLGSFYTNGGLIAVLLEMALFGFVCRKLDAMLDERSPALVRALGISWLSTLWMVWGSHDYWGAMLYGTLAMPALLLWFFSPKIGRAEASPRSSSQGYPNAALDRSNPVSPRTAP